MGFDLSVFFMAGAQDAVTPLPLIAAGGLLLVLLYVRSAPRHVLGGVIGVFAGTVVAAGVSIDLGFFHAWSVLVRGISLTAAGFFILLGLAFVITGAAFLREWYLLMKGFDRPFAGFLPPMRAPVIVVRLCTAAFAAGIVGLGYRVWPLNCQVSLQGIMSSGPGVLFHSLTAFVIYELCRHALCWMAVLAMVTSWFPRERARLRERKSLVSVVLAAFYLAMGFSVFLLLYMGFMQF